MDWRIDESIATSALHERVWCSPILSRRTHSHFGKRFHGDRESCEFEYFQREAAVAARISYTNFCNLIDSQLDVDRPILVYARLAGVPLPTWLDDQSQTPAIPLLLWIARQLLESLEVLHRLGYVHGNVQPEHMMMTASDRVTLLGIGCMEQVGQWTSLPRVQTRYDAPERLQDQFEASSAQDIYSAGIVIAELLRREGKQTPIIEAMIAERPEERPQAGELVRLLLALERELFGEHIRFPETLRSKAA